MVDVQFMIPDLHLEALMLCILNVLATYRSDLTQRQLPLLHQAGSKADQVVSSPSITSIATCILTVDTKR